MRVAIVCNDTRGGIQPYVALGLGLRAAGHEVRAVAPADLTALFTDAGLPAAPLSGSVEAVMRGSGVAERGALASIRFAARELPRHLAQWTREALQACEGMDLVTGGVGGVVVALSVAERLGLPFVESHLQPVRAPTDAYPGVMLAGVPSWLGGPGRRWSHHLSELAVWGPFRGAMQATREGVLGLRGRPTASDGQPVLYGFSPRVVPVPPGGPRPRHVTGYWTLPPPEGWHPPPGLEAFLARGGPVVSIGFGSMASEDPAALTRLVREAVRAAGVRAVLLAGWGGLDGAAGGEDLYAAPSLPHEWLFPRVAAVVHHGGAGTTGAALRAGVPSVVVPFTMDQPFWGSRVAALGVGPAPLRRRGLDQARLATALRQVVEDGAMRTRSEALGALLRSEDGVGEAVRRLEEVEPRQAPDRSSRSKSA